MTDDRRLIVLGAGGHAKVVGDVALETYLKPNLLFFDDHSHNDKSKSGLPVAGPIADAFLDCHRWSQFFVAIGDNSIRERYFQQLIAKGRSVIMLLSEAAYLSPSAEIGVGSIVMPRAVLNASACIGANVIVNTGAIVEHDCSVGAHSHLAPGSVLTGGSRIGSFTTIGAGAVVCPGVLVGDGVLVGAGAVATKDILEPGSYYGVPAKRLPGLVVDLV